MQVMNEAGLAEQGALPLSSPPPSQPNQYASTTAALGHATDQSPLGVSGARSGSQSIPNSQASHSPIPSQRSTLPGWPRIASKQSRSTNTAIIREFALVRQRVLVDQHAKIWSLSKELQGLDQDDAQRDVGQLRSLLFNPEHLVQEGNYQAHIPHIQYPLPQQPAQMANTSQPEQMSGQAPRRAPTGCATCSCDQEPKDQVLEALFHRLTNYYSFIKLCREIETLPKVSHYSYKNFRNFFQNDLPHGSDAWHALMDEPDDFISLEPELFHKKSRLFEWLFFGRPGLGKTFLKVFRSWKDSDEHAHVDEAQFEILYRTAIGLLYLAVTIGPVGILLLVPLSVWQSFIVVTVFSTLVLTVLSFRLDNFYSAFVAFATYIAIQITSLSILYQAGSN